MQSNSEQLQKSTPPYKRNFYLLNNNKERFSISTQIVMLWMLIITLMMMPLQKRERRENWIENLIGRGKACMGFRFQTLKIPPTQ